MAIGEAIGLGAATSAIDTTLGLGSQLLMNKFSYEQQSDLMDKAYEQQLDFWKMQQAYNDPSAQMQRLRRAGLNPALLNGNAVNNTAGGLSSVATPSAPNAHGVTPNTGAAIQSLGSVLKMSHETNFIDAQTAVFAQELFNKILDKEIKEIAKQTGFTELEIRRMEKEEVFQYLYGHPSAGGVKLERNRLIEAEENLKSQTALNNAESAYKDALSLLANANTEESRINAQKLVAEKGLLVIKADTEKSIQEYNRALANESKSKKDLNEQELLERYVLAPIKRRAMELANKVQASEAQKNEIEAALKQLDLDAKSNDKTGKPNAWYYIDETLETISSILGIAAGVYLGGKGAKSASKPPLYNPDTTNYSG